VDEILFGGGGEHKQNDSIGVIGFSVPANLLNLRPAEWENTSTKMKVSNARLYSRLIPRNDPG